MTELHFWADVILRQPRIRASSAQKLRRSRVVLFQKLFKGNILCFLGNLLMNDEITGIVHLRWIYLTTRFKYHFPLENYFAETLRWWWRNVSFHLEKRCHLPCQPVNPSLHALKKFPDDHRWRKLLHYRSIIEAHSQFESSTGFPHYIP